MPVPEGEITTTDILIQEEVVEDSTTEEGDDGKVEE